MFVSVPAAHATSSAAPQAPTNSATDVAGSGITWSLVPATADGPDDRVSVRADLEPGESREEYVTLTNFSEVAATFDVYASDGVLTQDGVFDILPPGQEPTDSGSWITLGNPADPAVGFGSVQRLQVDAGAAVTVPIQIQTPATATPGDHPAGIVAELVPDPGAHVTMANRVGVRAHIRVLGDVVGALEATEITATWRPSWNPFSPGTLTVDYLVQNTGNIRLAAQVAVTAHGPAGWGATTESAEVREILPASSAPGSLDLEVLPLVRSWANLEVTPQGVGQDQVPAQLAGFEDVIIRWTMPWSQLVLIALIVVGFRAWKIRRRRSADRLEARIEAEVSARTTALGERASVSAGSTQEP